LKKCSDHARRELKQLSSILKTSLIDSGARFPLVTVECDLEILLRRVQRLLGSRYSEKDDRVTRTLGRYQESGAAMSLPIFSPAARLRGTTDICPQVFQEFWASSQHDVVPVVMTFEHRTRSLCFEIATVHLGPGPAALIAAWVGAMARVRSAG
jgi:hypothetical protein